MKSSPHSQLTTKISDRTLRWKIPTFYLIFINGSYGFRNRDHHRYVPLHDYGHDDYISHPDYNLMFRSQKLPLLLTISFFIQKTDCLIFIYCQKFRCLFAFLYFIIYGHMSITGFFIICTYTNSIFLTSVPYYHYHIYYIFSFVTSYSVP